MIKQAVILCGRRGAHPDAPATQTLTALLPVDGTPFLDAAGDRTSGAHLDDIRYARFTRRPSFRRIAASATGANRRPR
jgi:hypothetical protein